MKIQIINGAGESISGYRKIIANRNNVDLSDLSNNECEFILAPDIVDMFSMNGIQQLIHALVSKLRHGGELVVGGTDIRLFCKAVSNGLITGEDASNIVTNVHSMTDHGYIKSTLVGLGLTVTSLSLNGIHYEMRVVRK